MSLCYLTATRQWHRIKTSKNPGELHSHSAICAFGSMFVFGGERRGSLSHDLWRFHFGNFYFSLINIFRSLRSYTSLLTRITRLATETWEKINAEGVIPNGRCRHTAVCNPFLDSSTWWDQENVTNGTRLSRPSSAKSCLKESQNNKALVLAPPKSISMCFGQPTDTPLHENGKALKPFKLKHYPMPGLCSRKSSATLSDEEEEDFDEVNGLANDNNFGPAKDPVEFDNRNSQVTLRFVSFFVSCTSCNCCFIAHNIRIN